MGFPFEHISQRDGARESNGEIDSRLHSIAGLEARTSRLASAPTPKLASDSSSLKKSSE
jgi:hypothetical protein